LKRYEEKPVELNAPPGEILQEEAGGEGGITTTANAETATSSEKLAETTDSSETLAETTVSANDITPIPVSEQPVKMSRRWSIAPPTREQLWTGIAFGGVFLLGALLRFWGLGDKPLHHDESLHAYFSLQLMHNNLENWLACFNAPANVCYRYDPLLHGPFQFHIIALVYKISQLLGVYDHGVNTTTVRIPAATLGTLIVILPYFLRQHLGKVGAWLACFLLAISPSMVYFSRFAREDIYMACFTLLLVVSSVQYIRTRKLLWIVLAGLAFALSYATKEATFLMVAVFGSFFGALLVWEIGLRLPSPFHQARQSPQAFQLAGTSPVPAPGQAENVVPPSAEESQVAALPATEPAEPAEEAVAPDEEGPQVAALPVAEPAQQGEEAVSPGEEVLQVAALPAAEPLDRVEDAVSPTPEWTRVVVLPATEPPVFAGAPGAIPATPNPWLRTSAPLLLAGYFLVLGVFAKWFFGWLKNLSIYITANAANTKIADDYVSRLKYVTELLTPMLGMVLAIVVFVILLREQWVHTPGNRRHGLARWVDPVRQPLLNLIATMPWTHWFFALVAGWTIFLVLFTALFTYMPQGIGDGVWQGLYYWVQQQQVARGGQPWYYYFLLIPLYEQIGLVFGLVGLLRCLLRPTRLRLFLAYWFVGNVFIYSWAGEKMPWLAIHITMPMMLLAAIGLEPIVVHLVALVNRWRTRPAPLLTRETPATPPLSVPIDGEDGEEAHAIPVDSEGSEEAHAILVDSEDGEEAHTIPVDSEDSEEAHAIPVDGEACSEVLPVPPGDSEAVEEARLPVPLSSAEPVDAEEAGAPVPVLVAAAARVEASSAPVQTPLPWFRSEGMRTASTLFGALVALLLLVPTLQNMFQVTYVHPADAPYEMMIYVQTTTDVNIVMAKVDKLDQDLYGGRHELPIGLTDDATWPFAWYLRDYTNVCFKFPSGCPATAQSIPVIIAGGDSLANIQAQYGKTHEYHQYQMRTQWNQGYMPPPCVRTKTNPCSDPQPYIGVGPWLWLSYGNNPPPNAKFDLGLAAEHIWQWWWQRRPIGGVDGGYNMELFIRKDLNEAP